MERLGVVYTNQFMLLAVDKRYNINQDYLDHPLPIPAIRKAYKLNDYNLVSAAGQFYKCIDILTYLRKLEELDPGSSTYDVIIEDLKDLFSNSKKVYDKSFKRAASILRTYRGKGIENVNDVYDMLNDDPDTLAIFKDIVNEGQSGMSGLLGTFAVILSRDTETGQNIFGRYLIKGNFMEGITMDNSKKKDHIGLRFFSDKVDISVISKLHDKLLKEFIKPYNIIGWEDDRSQTDILIQKSKELLAKGLQHLTPYAVAPEVLIYELSHATDFKFKEPPDKLVNAKLSRDPKIQNRFKINLEEIE